MLQPAVVGEHAQAELLLCHAQQVQGELQAEPAHERQYVLTYPGRPANNRRFCVACRQSPRRTWRVPMTTSTPRGWRKPPSMPWGRARRGKGTRRRSRWPSHDSGAGPMVGRTRFGSALPGWTGELAGWRPWAARWTRTRPAGLGVRAALPGWPSLPARRTREGTPRARRARARGGHRRAGPGGRTRLDARLGGPGGRKQPEAPGALSGPVAPRPARARRGQRWPALGRGHAGRVSARRQPDRFPAAGGAPVGRGAACAARVRGRRRGLEPAAFLRWLSGASGTMKGNEE